MVKFNRSKPPPDAEDPGVVSGFTAADHSTTETGFRWVASCIEVLRSGQVMRFLQGSRTAIFVLIDLLFKFSI